MLAERWRSPARELRLEGDQENDHPSRPHDGHLGCPQPHDGLDPGRGRPRGERAQRVPDWMLQPGLSPQRQLGQSPHRSAHPRSPSPARAKSPR